MKGEADVAEAARRRWKLSGKRLDAEQLRVKLCENAGEPQKLWEFPNHVVLSGPCWVWKPFVLKTSQKRTPFFLKSEKSSGISRKTCRSMID